MSSNDYNNSPLLPSYRRGSAVRRWSTRRQRQWWADNAALRSLYQPLPATQVLTSNFLQDGLLALGDVANLDRLERLDENDIRGIVSCLIEQNWSKADIEQLLGTWRKVRAAA